MVTFGAAWAGLLMLAEQEIIVVTTRHDVSPKYRWHRYEAACGSHLFQVRFGYDGEENGRVGPLLIDGRAVPDAAEALDIRAARRLITGIKILDCGTDPQRPVLRGTIDFLPGESRRLGMRWSLAFRLTREGRDSWRITID
jgi:hypothetical protein